MKAFQRTMYLVGLALCIGFAVLYPSWIGALYNPDPLAPGGYYEGGTFGLSTSGGLLGERAPVWNPPEPTSDAIRASVRWPWQPVTAPEHVEVAVTAGVLRLSLCVLVLGYLLWASRYLRAQTNRTRDAFVTMAVCVSLSLSLAWIAIIAIAAVSSGYGATDAVLIPIVVVASAGGILAGTMAGRPESTASVPAQKSSIVSKLGWFALGVALSLAIVFVAELVASHFRGAIVGVTELGTTRYATNQTPINVGAGIGIIVAGWTLWFALRRSGVSPRLQLGLAIGATVLGIVFALR
ncbi:MAG: hypothetical protein JNK53_04740 [Phycisphaerae bacterium]|nr:hypothetical protein [Phycisphaerae bacterium]